MAKKPYQLHFTAFLSSSWFQTLLSSFFRLYDKERYVNFKLKQDKNMLIGDKNGYIVYTIRNRYFDGITPETKKKKTLY